MPSASISSSQVPANNQTVFRLDLFCRNNYFIVKNIVLVTVLLVLEEIIGTYFFSCPCFLDLNTINSTDFQTSNQEVPGLQKLYGTLYIFTPAVIIFILASLCYERTWRCVTGWRVHSKFNHCSRTCGCFMRTIIAALQWALVWFVAAFLDGRYYECSNSVVPNVCLSKADFVGQSTLRSKNAELYVQSQTIGCFLAIATIGTYFIVKLLLNCCSSTTYYQRKYFKLFKQVEMEAFHRTAEEKLEFDLKAKWRKLFNHGDQDDWIDISELPPTNPKWKDDRQILYTPLHEWRHEEFSKLSRAGLIRQNNPGAPTNTPGRAFPTPTPKPTPDIGVFPVTSTTTNYYSDSNAYEPMNGQPRGHMTSGNQSETSTVMSNSATLKKSTEPLQIFDYDTASSQPRTYIASVDGQTYQLTGLSNGSATYYVPEAMVAELSETTRVYDVEDLGALPMTDYPIYATMPTMKIKKKKKKRTSSDRKVITEVDVPNSSQGESEA